MNKVIVVGAGTSGIKAISRAGINKSIALVLIENPFINIKESLMQLEQAFKKSGNVAQNFSYELRKLSNEYYYKSIPKKRATSNEWYRKFDKRPRI